MKSDISGNYKLVCALVEDSVKGTSAGYNQSNAYAGGSNGVMGGFETLANPVPASKMVYDHVGRFISPSFNGLSNAYGSSAKAGDTFVHTFTFPIDATWNFGKMHIVGMFIEPTGLIDNGYSISTLDALNGIFLTGSEVLNTKQWNAQSIKITPNPAEDYLNIQCGKDIQSIEIVDLKGCSIQRITPIRGEKVAADISNLPCGIYMVVLTSQNGTLSEKFMKK
jgi:hypothetical protein